MKIIIEEPSDSEEDHIIFRCHSLTPELLKIIAMINTQGELTAYTENEIHRIRTTEIYYIEVIDNKTFLYCKDKVYEVKQKLYELEDILSNSDLLRVSKSSMLNLSKIKLLRPALSGRFEAILDNGEIIIISRQYVSDLKKSLEYKGAYQNEFKRIA